MDLATKSGSPVLRTEQRGRDDLFGSQSQRENFAVNLFQSQFNHEMLKMEKRWILQQETGS